MKDEDWLESDTPQLQLGRAAYETAMAATAVCKGFGERLDMYLLAAEAGHAEARVRYWYSPRKTPCRKKPKNRKLLVSLVAHSPEFSTRK